MAETGAELEQLNGNQFALSYQLVNYRLRRVNLVMLTIIMLVMLSSVVLSMVVRHRHLDPVSFFWMAGLSILPLIFMSGMVALATRAQAADIFMSDGKLRFSSIWKYSLLNRLERDWSDVHSVQVTYPETMSRSSRPIFRGEKLPLTEYLTTMGVGPNISFDFKSGGTADISLHLLTKKQAEDLFNAIETYGDASKFSGDFVKMQKAILMDRLDSKSFTQIWSESLSPRYVSTNYVPLATNHKLQDGRYKVLMELAAGGMSAVYLARGDSGAKVVLKESVLPADISDEQKLKARQLFERESRLLLKLHHPHIARVLDRFVEDNRDYLVLEYISGLTLRQVVQTGGKQKEKDVLDWGRQLAEILVYLHGQEPPVVHRDLTPDNVILKDDGKIYLVDFGAANEFVGQATGTMIGKQCYIAPEQLRGKANQASDIYALGGTMCFMLTGEDPEPLASSRVNIKEPHISSATSALIESMTAFDLSDRVSSAAAVVSALADPAALPAHPQRSL